MLDAEPPIEDVTNLISNFSLSASSNATNLHDSFNATALGISGEPIPDGFEVRLLPVARKVTSSQAFYGLMMQALCQFAMSDYESQTYPSTFHDSKSPYDEYAMMVYGLTSSSPRTLATIKTRLALWGLLRVLERISELRQWTAVKAEFYMDGSSVGGLYFGFGEKFSRLEIGTDLLIGGSNTDLGSDRNPLVLASDPSINRSSSTKELIFNYRAASKATSKASPASITSSSSSSLSGKHGRMELIPHYGQAVVNPHHFIVSCARALAIGGLAIPPKSDQPPPSIRFEHQDLQTVVFFDKAAPMATLPVWTYEWIITAISHVVHETWAPPDWGLYSCVYDVKVDGILLGYVGIGPLR